MTALRIFTRFHLGSNLWRNLQHQQNQQHSLLRISTGSFCTNGYKINDSKNSQRHWTHNNNNNYVNNKYLSTKTCPDQAGKTDSKSAAVSELNLFGETSNLGLFAKFKLMYKKYWYVLVPVHIVTSIGWLGGFYYLSKSGVDVPALLQSIHVSEAIIEKIRTSDMGHIAIAYLCYKVATPVRYAVTLGGTTLSIKHLVQMGYIKPMPTKEEFIQMYEDRKATRAAAAKEKEDAEMKESSKQQQEQQQQQNK